MIMRIKKGVKKILRRKIKPDMVTLYSKRTKNFRGTALVSYLKDYIFYDDNDSALDGHTNKWESKAIAHILADLGFNVDVIDYNNFSFIPTKKYNLVLDIHYNLDRLAYSFSEKTVKLLHITGSYPEYSVKKELERVDALEKRRGVLYSPKRVCDVVHFNRSLRIADQCSLIGNQHTKETFPEEFRNKIKLIAVSSAKFIDKNFIFPLRRDFLWFNGQGAVHKGLDLLIEIFSRHKEWCLNIVGGLGSEPDFMQIYEEELSHCENIRFHGSLNPRSIEFQKILNSSCCFIAPSCSEGISTASTTCLQAGLYPILSKDNGIDLPENCGILLDEVTISNIETAIKRVNSLSDSELYDQILITKKYAEQQFSRSRFKEDMHIFLENAILKQHTAG